MRMAILALSGLLTFLFILGRGYNTLKGKEGVTIEAWKDVEKSSKQRLEIIRGYLDAVEKYASKDMQVLREVETAACNAASAGIPTTPPKSPQILLRFRNVQTELTRTLAQLLVIERNYPELLADANYIALHRRLEAAERCINNAIVAYNNAGHDFNTSRNAFPHSLTNALLLRYSEKETFKACEDAALVDG